MDNRVVEHRTTIVLIGPMGVGKTTVGQRLAARLDRPLLDSDQLIEASVGATAAEIAEREGVDALHHLEADVLLRSLDHDVAAVVAAAASVVDQRDVVDRLRSGPELVVSLTADRDVREERAAGAAHRRAIGDEELDRLRRRLERYREVADVELDTTGLSPAEIVDRVIAAI